MFIDCHCHLTSEQFQDDLEEVLARSRRAGVQGILTCSTSPSDMLHVVQLREEHPDDIYACLGIHPLDDSCDMRAWQTVREMIIAEHRKHGLAALGEIGLDFSRPLLKQKAAARGATEADVRNRQLSLFEAQLDLARELDLPVNVHSRNAEKEVLNILSGCKIQGVMHAYKGPAALALQAAKSGRLWFSFPPSLVYKWEYQEAVKALPLECLLLETDSPSLAAAGPKARNEPGFIRAAAEKMAELKGVTLQQVAAATTRNAVHLFGKASPGLQACCMTAPPSNPTGKTSRWRRDVKDNEGNVPTSDAPPAQTFAPQDRSSQRWTRRSRGAETHTMDPTLCSSAFGSARCS
ncbi:tatdn3-a [Symbiodinium natans]|uniref:Tatdn3-a protein n=1 Tax=Symbiodinium natans TaxID=878477 RepID=A0A812SZ18_9DINO|nr:tatdn3-a [Symbiodinium natans]